MFKLLVITLVCVTVVLAATRDEPEMQLTSTARPSGPAMRKLSGLTNQSSSYLSQESEPKAPSKRSDSNLGTKQVQPAQQPRQQPNSLDNLGGQFSQQKGQQARPSQPRQQQSDLDFAGHF